MTYPLPNGDFEFISAVAVLHHLPLSGALVRFRNLLKTGGVLVVVGLYRSRSMEDYAWAAAGFTSSRVLRYLRGYAEVTGPLRDARETFAEIRRASHDLLPGSCIRRHLLFRYSITWRKPQ